MREILGEPHHGLVSVDDGSPLPPNLPPYLVPPADIAGLLPLTEDVASVKMIDLGQGQYKSALVFERL